MNILITGANGLVGNQIVQRFLKTNHSVTVIVRRKENIFFDESKVNIFIGDFTNYEELKKAAENCEAIIHAAAVTDMGFLEYSVYEKVNYYGTLNVLKAAEELNIKKIIYISTSNTIGNGNTVLPGDEKNIMSLPFTDSFYALSKKAAEDALLEQNKVETVILNVCFVAAISANNASSSRLVNYGYKKRLIFVPKGGKNYVGINKVAEAAFQAAFNGVNKEKYLICGENLTYKEFFKKMAEALNYKQTQIEIYSWILKSVGFLGDLLRKLGIKTELSSVNIKQLLTREYLTGEKADNQFKLNNFDLENFYLHLIH